MLVLARKVGEAVVITAPPSDKAARVTITVTQVRGDKCRLGIEAPSKVACHRGEVQRAVDAAESAAGPDSDPDVDLIVRLTRELDTARRERDAAREALRLAPPDAASE